jgi:sarcosine oxidase subunit alpha
MKAGTGRRLPSGGLVDRGKPLAFHFDGRELAGYEGDTLASALLANGVDVVGRSFKYHRPRGIMTAGAEEPNALVTLRTGTRAEPNTRATCVELFGGLEASSQNRWPSLAFDLLSLNRFLGPVLGAGFYYKTFMWPASFWEKVYEPLIRRAAGLGRAADGPDPDIYEKAVAFCDVLVIGAGPAGLMAALSAGRAGARVILADEDFRMGGRLLSERREIDGAPATAWIDTTLAELEGLPEVRLMPRTTIFGAYDGATYGAVERVSDHLREPRAHMPRQRSWRIVAKRTILATGAIERPIVFPGNDRPRVMLASAARSYINRFAVMPSARPILFTTSDDGWATARDALAAGARPAAIVDARTEIDPSLVAMARDNDIPLFKGAHVGSTHGRCVEAADIVDAAGRVTRIACDGVLVANGWNPSLALTCHLGGKPVFDEAIAAFVPGACPPGMQVAGAAAGRFALAQALADGARLGTEAAADCGFTGGSAVVPGCDPERSDHAPLAGQGEQGEGVRRSPERRYRGRYRARPSRGVPSRRAPQALHDTGNGDRSGQDRQHGGPRDHGGADRTFDPTGWHHHVPPSDIPGRHRSACGASSRQAFPPDPAHAVTHLGEREWRGLRRERSLAASAVFPAQRRKRLAPDR